MDGQSYGRLFSGIIRDMIITALLIGISLGILGSCTIGCISKYHIKIERNK